MGIILGAMAAAGDEAIRGIDEGSRQRIAQENADHQSSLDIQKAQAIDDMKRTRSANDATAITSASDKARLDRIADLMNTKRDWVNADGTTGSTDGTNKFTADSPEVAAIASSPDKLKANGIIDRARSQEYDDKVKAAEGIGADDKAKELRGQQTLEISRDAEERRGARMDAQTAAATAETARKSKHDEDTAAAAADRDVTNNRRIDALIAKQTGTGGQKAEKVMTLLDAQRKEATSEAGEINRRMTEELKGNKFGTADEIAAIKKSYEPELKAIKKKRAQIDADFGAVREKFGLPALMDDEDGGNSTPSQSTPAQSTKTPAGMKYIGTTPDGKKAVYEDANGKRFTN